MRILFLHLAPVAVPLMPRDKQKDQVNKDENWKEIYPSILLALAKRGTVAGKKCQAMDCHESAEWCCSSCQEGHAFCQLHVINKPFDSCHLRNSRYEYYQTPGTNRMLLLSTHGWKYADECNSDTLINHGFFPGSPKSPSIY